MVLKFGIWLKIQLFSSRKMKAMIKNRKKIDLNFSKTKNQMVTKWGLIIFFFLFVRIIWNLFLIIKQPASLHNQEMMAGRTKST